MSEWLFTRARLGVHRSRTQSVAAMLQSAAASDAGHALIWSLFPQDQKDRNFLYREVTQGEYLILSRTPPRDELGLWELATRDYSPELARGDRLFFSLRADVQFSTPPLGDGPKRARGPREPLHMAAKRRGMSREALAREWIAEQLNNHGALLTTIPPRADTTQDPKLSDLRPGDYLTVQVERQRRLFDGSRRGALQPILFEGALEVTAPAALITLLTTGLGRSRAYGCGLMLVRRL